MENQNLLSINGLRATSILQLVGVILFVVSCSGKPAGKGSLEIRVKDHRAAIDDFAKLEVAVESIRLKPWGNWIDLKPALANFDLTAYRKGNSVSLFKGEIESGSFEGFHLQLGNIGGMLKKGNSRVEVKNGVVPIQLPIALEPNQPTLLIIDLEVFDMSDHAGSGYELHLKGYEHFRDGKLIDRVPPS